VLPFLARARQRFEEAGLDFWVAMLLMNPRSVTCLMNILYDKDDADETRRAEALYASLLADMQAAGYQQYRAGLLAWGKVHERATELLRLQQRIKSTVDPNGTLAPGRYGIGIGPKIPGANRSR
jgi:4-cresol dehydrogenase (hydroxylating)